ncbi:glycosyltransferase family 1 protein [Tenacibaculum aiptasiae]|uniref:Glycosyltransferase family 1 protein n=1 Tax=Tenacibaculum aiptasiae TaxID=426481 RepID=A0A7J5A8C1_9FLAO|nr:glycosyltransferase [Tenacibaculum aiptasiae]KAB1153379.1 glycosyltransferase family 1 protein [Tenacibaculum aiptasiae]
MKILLFGLGSRGDIEPLFSIGETLKEKEHDVVYVFPEQFREMVELTNSTFYGFTSEFIEVLLESENSKTITSRKGTLIKRIKSLFVLAKKSIRINKEVTLTQKEIIDKEKPNYVFFNQKCVYPIIWGIRNQNRSIFIHPFPCFLHPVKHHSFISFSGGGNYGKYLNLFSYKLQLFIFSLAIYYSTRSISKNEFKKITPKQIRKHLITKTLSMYTVSSSLFEKPKYWNQNAKIIGFTERNKRTNWEPQEELLRFLKYNSKQKIVFITFGSISNPNPKKITQFIIDTISKHNIPAIINTSWGGLVKLENCSENIYFTENIPYDWVFPKVHSVIHHGGAGTTHSAIKYGCSSLIIPHFIDQFYWNKVVAEKKLGPKGVSIKKLNATVFEKLLLDLLKNTEYKKNAMTFSNKLKKESKSVSFTNIN